jgi:subtilisin family serine protease
MVTLATGLLAPTGGFAADARAPVGAPDEILVRYRPDSTQAERRAVAREHGLTQISTSRTGRTAVVRGNGVSPATVRRLLAADPRVVAVGRNYRRELQADPTDPGFKYEWGLHNRGQRIDGIDDVTGIVDVDIDGLEALRIEHGNSDIVVAVIDDGVDFTHPDLAARAWDNPGETPGDSVDNDGNGLVDDVHGWDFCHNDASLHDANKDGHGTHVAGTIGATVNNGGVVGVAPGVTIMGLKFLEEGNDDCGLDSQAINAIEYAVDKGATLINASWGGVGLNPVLDMTIADSGLLFVAAAGNAGLDLDVPNVAFYPAESNAPNVLSVGAIDQNGELADFTNYGATAVDVMAPGTNILSSYPPIPGCPAPCYVWSAGTSMAAPHVTGIAALALSRMSTPPTAAALRSFVLTRGSPLAQAGCLSSTGRLANALRAVTSAGPTAIPPCTWKFDVGSAVGSSISATLSWPAATGNLSGVSYSVLRRKEAGSWTTIATQTSRSIRQSLSLGSAYRYAVRTRSSNGSLGPTAYAQYIEPALFQEATSLARYSGRWTTTTSSSASGGKLRWSTQAGAWVEFRRAMGAIAIVGRKSPTSGKARIFVDGTLVSTIDLSRSSAQSRVVLFSRSWTTIAAHTVRVEVVGTSGRPRVDIDGFVVLR